MLIYFCHTLDVAEGIKPIQGTCAFRLSLYFCVPEQFRPGGVHWF